MEQFWNEFPILSVITLFLGAFLTSLVGRASEKAGRVVSGIAVTAPLAMMLCLIRPVMLQGQIITYWLGGWEPVEGWAIGICLEVDALSLFFALIVTVAVFVSCFYAFTYMNHDDALSNYYTLFLMLSGSVLGLVLSGDLFNVFVMIEIMTFTAVALTAFRTTYEGALEGAFKYLAVGSLGSTCVLVGIAMTYSQLHTLNLAQIAALMPAFRENTVLHMAFAFLFVGFGTKAFLFPFHPLAADAHAVAPASISLMISGVLTKCGVYGIIRLIYVLFQNANVVTVSYLVTGFGAVSMFVCVTMAFNQHNFKRLLAFHSISQVGYVITVAGLSSALGLGAGLYHAMNHTIFKGLLFLTAGAVQHQTGSLDLDRLGGLSRRMPKTTALFLIGAASISGLPPFNGFASKWMIYQATFTAGMIHHNLFYLAVCVCALITSVLTLASFIKVTQSVFFGQLPAEYAGVEEVPLSMRAPMWVLAALCLLTGIFPAQIQRFLLTPAVSAVANIPAYVDAAMGEGYAAAHGVPGAEVSALPVGGAWSPLSWLALLFSVTCAVAIVAILGSARDEAHEYISQTQDGAAGAKYDSFFSGEEAVYSQVGGSDLFWGFKHNWKRYFAVMRRWHSGIVNDYTLYGVAAIAFVLLVCTLAL